MPAADRSLDIIAFVSEHFRDILRRRLSELFGLALLTIALLGAIALATWSVQDPSLSHATQKPIHNLLGFAGAIFSDLAMQLLGLASVLLLLPATLLGWRLLSHRPIGEKWRGVVYILAVLLAAGFASTLPIIGSWPLPTGLGGVFGDALLQVPAFVSGASLAGFVLIVVSAALALATAATLAIATGLRWPRPHTVRAKLRDANEDEDEEDETGDDHASAWLGLVAHALLSWKARFVRLVRGAPRPARPAAMPAGTRLEPRFDQSGFAAAPDEGDDLFVRMEGKINPDLSIREGNLAFYLPDLSIFKQSIAKGAAMGVWKRGSSRLQFTTSGIAV